METREILEEIVKSIDRLSDEVSVLRNVMDDIREDLQWAVRNDRLKIYAPPDEPA